MKLQLTPVPADTQGIYTIRGVAGRLPPRALFLHPAAAAAFKPLAAHVVVSDMFRSPESSLAAVRSGRGAKPPGYSGHNYGLSIDIDIMPTWSRIGGIALRLDKGALDEHFEQYGWYCHRRDHLIGSEAWHYNHLGYEANADIRPRAHSTAGALETKIMRLYGGQFELGETAAQMALARLRLYSGELDGVLGPLSREAICAFQRTWGLKATGSLDATTQRTLAYVAADKEIL